MTDSFTWIDWAVLLFYFSATMLIGFYFYRKTRTTAGFTTASQSLPGWACGLSIFATYLSSISFLALPGKAFASNWNPFVFSLSLPITTIVAVYFFMPYYRKSGEVSAYAHLEHRFGPWARMYASFFYLLTQLARMGTVMYLMALPLNLLLGWDIRTIILITGISVTVYSFVGGITAVIWADALQAFVLMAGAFICSAIMLFNMPEGPSQVFTIAAENNKFSLGEFSLSLTAPTFWVVLFYGIVINLQNFGIDQNFVQRYISAKSNREAKKSVWLGGLLYLPVSAVFFFIGTQLYAYYQVNPNDLQQVKTVVASQQLQTEGLTRESPDYAAQLATRSEQLTDKDIGDKVFPHFIGTKLPAGVTGLLIAAIFSAAMSTISTSLNSSATLLTTDWYKRLFNKNASEKQSMIALYIATIVWGLGGTAVAFLLINITSALDAWWTLSGIFGGGMLGLFLLGATSKRANSPVAVTAVLLGLFIICWMTLSPKLPDSLASLRNGFHSFLVPVFGTATILMAGFLFCQFFQSKSSRGKQA
jgi:SSS family solute:Na+ symporter